MFLFRNGLQNGQLTLAGLAPFIHCFVSLSQLTNLNAWSWTPEVENTTFPLIVPIVAGADGSAAGTASTPTLSPNTSVIITDEPT